MNIRFPTSPGLLLPLALGSALVLCPAPSSLAADASPAPAHGAIRALAPDHVAFDEAPSTPSRLSQPSILRLDGGRLVAASSRDGTTSRRQGHWLARISTSDDGGLSWTPRATR